MNTPFVIYHFFLFICIYSIFVGLLTCAKILFIYLSSFSFLIFSLVPSSNRVNQEPRNSRIRLFYFLIPFLFRLAKLYALESFFLIRFRFCLNAGFWGLFDSPLSIANNWPFLWLHWHKQSPSSRNIHENQTNRY